MDSYTRPAYKEPIYYILGIATILVITLILVQLYVWYPQDRAEWDKKKLKIDSLNCRDLGKFLVKNSLNYTYVNDGYIHISEYTYADAKLHAGDCK
jgi:hypothetical protein